MARGDKRVELRTVDDEAVQPEAAVRLPSPGKAPPPEEKPIRLPGPALPKEPSRLDVPTRDDLELRSHQPGIEALIETDTGNPDYTEESWGEGRTRSHPLPWGWFLLLGLAISAAVIWSLTRIGTADQDAERRRSETQVLLSESEQQEQEARQLVDRIELALRVYFSANSVASMSRLVRQHERVLPLMRDYYQRHPFTATPLKSVRVLQPLTLENRGNFWMASVVLTDNRLRNLIIEIDPAGNPLIDWETLVCYQPLEWDEFARKRPAGSSLDFRVYVQPDAFFSHEFADSGKWLCFRLTALDSDETLFGYVAADKPLASEITSLSGINRNQRTSMILRLSIPSGLRSRQGVIIEKIMSPRWIYLDPPAPGS